MQTSTEIDMIKSNMEKSKKTTKRIVKSRTSEDEIPIRQPLVSKIEVKEVMPEEVYVVMSFDTPIEIFFTFEEAVARRLDKSKPPIHEGVCWRMIVDDSGKPEVVYEY